MLLDAGQLSDGELTGAAFDVCICGAGPAGITLARTLAGIGWRVALMEGGGLEPDARSQALYQGEIVGLPYYPLDACRLRYFGGTSNHWGGYTRPLDRRDFEVAPHDPLNAWPIKKTDLDPFADTTAEILDLPPAEAPLDLFAGKEAAIEPSLYRVSPTRFGSKYRDELARSERIRLVLNANMVDIRLASGLRSVDAFVFCSNARDERFAVRARHFALCCGGIETARLLLDADRQVPGGIGNSHDLVGRYFSEHLEIEVGRTLLKSPLADLNFYIASDKLVAERQCLAFELELLPLAADDPSCALPFDERLARALRDPEHACFDAILFVVAGQTLNRDSRVALSDKRDRFGLRQLKLDWRLSNIDGETLRVAAEEMGRAMARHDIGRLHLDPWVASDPIQVPISEESGGSSHHMCTTRMSADPAAGVVDADCRVHGIDNLFIGGSSVFASPGVSNPTFTIVQLALRLAEHLNARLTRGQ